MTPQADQSRSPKPLSRSKFDHWCWLRGLKLSEIGEAVGCKPERARRMRLPFGDPLRVIPDEAEMSRIAEFTEGEIGPSDFYLLSGSEAVASEGAN